MKFDYTQVYREIYSIVKKEDTPHELAHNTSLKITNALSDLFLSSQGYDLELIPIIINAMTNMIDQKFGGYDLDDRESGE